MRRLSTRIINEGSCISYVTVISAWNCLVVRLIIHPLLFSLYLATDLPLLIRLERFLADQHRLGDYSFYFILDGSDCSSYLRAQN